MSPHSVRTVLSRLLYERGWSDGEFALRIGVSRSRVNLIKNRRAMPTIREALLIAQALDMQVEQVFVLTDSGAPARAVDQS
jgi:transcriptional regulator with XRE-family HTH domain